MACVRKFVVAIKEVIDPTGLDYDISVGHRHPRVTITSKKRSYTRTFSTTRSIDDNKFQRYFMRDLRRDIANALEDNKATT
jgi:hypothetical protein